MRVEDKDLSTFFAYAYGTAGWFGLQSTVLVIFPKLAISLLASDESHHTSDLEVYFARSLGFALTTLALVVLFFTGAVPIDSATSRLIRMEENDPRAPYAAPILLVTTFFHVLSTVYCYSRYLNSGQTGFVLGLVASGGLACVGAWSVIFGFTSRVSARTGEDKRTSGFLFPNKSAYNKKADRKTT